MKIRLVTGRLKVLKSVHDLVIGVKPAGSYLKTNYLLRMSEREEQDFMTEYLTWMKGPGLDQKALHVYNFGYDRPLQFASITLSPDSKMRFNLQTSGMSTQTRSSIAVVGEKYVGRFEEIMLVIDRIHEDTQALPLVIFLQSEYEIKLENMSSHHMRETPGFVGILFKLNREVVLTPRLLRTE